VVVLFEAPHRVREALEDIAEAFGGRRLAVGRELTKLYEEVFHGTAQEAVEHFSQPRGEFVIAIEGAPAGAHGPIDAEVAAALERLRQAGLDGRTLVERAAEETGAPRSRVYRIHLKGDGR
jgi:16S rRNA (cytidine1402-2'-O)-methyltransferase